MAGVKASFFVTSEWLKQSCEERKMLPESDFLVRVSLKKQDSTAPADSSVPLQPTAANANANANAATSASSTNPAAGSDQQQRRSSLDSWNLPSEALEDIEHNEGGIQQPTGEGIFSKRTVAIVTPGWARARATMINMLCSRGARVIHGQTLCDYVAELAKDNHNPNNSNPKSSSSSAAAARHQPKVVAGQEIGGVDHYIVVNGVEKYVLRSLRAQEARVGSQFWAEQCINDNILYKISAAPKVFQPFPHAKISRFQDVKLALTGCPKLLNDHESQIEHSYSVVAKLVKFLGAEIVESWKTCTHLVVGDAHHQTDLDEVKEVDLAKFTKSVQDKIDQAKKRNIKVVRLAWLYDSLIHGTCASDKKYLLVPSSSSGAGGINSLNHLQNNSSSAVAADVDSSLLKTLLSDVKIVCSNPNDVQSLQQLGLSMGVTLLTTLPPHVFSNQEQQQPEPGQKKLKKTKSGSNRLEKQHSDASDKENSHSTNAATASIVVRIVGENDAAIDSDQIVDLEMERCSDWF